MNSPMNSKFKISKCLNICVFASGGGGNLKYLIERQDSSIFEISCLVVDVKCGAETVAAQYDVPVLKIENRDGHLNFNQLADNEKIINSDIIILAGFMPIVPPLFIKQYGKLMLNTHPSLLPKHGGKGMHGVSVQESVIKSGDLIAGCTCHIVDEGIDTGRIICQKTMTVDPNLSPWELGGQVFLLEGPNLLNALKIVKEKMEKG